MLTREAILEPVAEEHVAEFCENLQARVAIRPGVTWADQPTFADRLGAFIDSDLGARVFTAVIAFSAAVLVVLGMAAVAKARGF